MKKYNSVYTASFTIDHNKEDASDVTQKMLVNRLYECLMTDYSSPWRETDELPLSFRKTRKKPKKNTQ